MAGTAKIALQAGHRTFFPAGIALLDLSIFWHAGHVTVLMDIGRLRKMTIH
jgi:hypothetical protein